MCTNTEHKIDVNEVKCSYDSSLKEKTALISKGIYLVTILASYRNDSIQKAQYIQKDT